MSLPDMERAKDPQAWNVQVQQRAPESGAFLQSWQWGVVHEVLGARVDRYQNNEACAQVMTRRLPLGQSYGWLSRGPLADTPEAAKALQKHLVAQMPWLFLRIDVVDLEQVDQAMRQVADVQPACTWITAAQEPEQLLAGMHSKTRYNIRVAARHDVVATIEPSWEGALDTFMALLQQTERRHGVRFHTRAHYEAILRTCTGEEGGPRAFLATASRKGQPLAMALFLDWAGQRTYLHGASDDQEKARMAPYALHWMLLQDAFAQGLTTYDWWGIAPEGAAEHRLSGVTRFKCGFPGQRVTYPGTWDVPLRPLGDRLYRIAQWLRRR